MFFPLMRWQKCVNYAKEKGSKVIKIYGTS